MLTLKSWTEIVFRCSLIAVIVFNALIPTAAIAMPLAEENRDVSDSALSANALGAKGSRGQFLSSSLSSSTFFQDGTPTVTPTETVTETLTPEPSTTPTAPQATPATPATLETTPFPSVTPTTTPTSGDTTLPSLALEFSATPAQAKVGDRVAFALTITNKGTTAVAGLLFSNILPEGFHEFQSDDKDFTFDPNTRELIWKQQAPDPAGQIPPGGSLTLAYSVLADLPVKDVNILDTANLSADGLKEPLLVESTLALLSADGSLALLNNTGGEAVGLGGRVKLTLPAPSLEAPVTVFIQDLNTQPSPAPEAEPWLQFRLERYLAQPLASTVAIPNPAGLENDRTTPLEPIEAPFKEPVELNVSFDGLVDLAALTADSRPFLVTLDEASGTWVRVPLKKIDREGNLITAELPHFSTWGVGFGPSFPQNGAGVILFDNAYPTLFTGRSKYSIPLWTPPGRNGMAPSLALSYSSGSADGVLGDVQAPWTGMGWSIDSAEIARKITNGGCDPCGGGSYGYENEFLLLFNGTGYELFQSPTTPDRYHTKEESFLYIQRHNDALGSPSTANATGEWWEVVEKDGTRWRLGYTGGSEQRAAMAGYPGTNPPTGAWATLGYAGNEPNVVALRWRADQVTDVYGNRMSFTYFEESRTVGSVTYDQASYIDTISYTSHTSGSPAAGYSVEFVLQERGTNDVPTTTTDWDNWDTKRLDRVEVNYGTSLVRTYNLSYQVGTYVDGGVTWQTTKLTSVAISGGATVAPTITFTYVDKDNRAPNGGSSNEWPYPRMATISNGWGGAASYVYGNDGRPYTSWYNWRVTQFDVTDSVNANPKRVTFAYSTPAYGAEGELIGYQQTTETTLDYSLSTFAKTVHKFWTNSWEPVGREYETLYQNASGTTLRKTLSNWIASWSNGYPDEVAFYYAPSVEEYILDATLELVKETQYEYDLYTGNLLQEREYDGNSSLYRQTDYEYVTDTSPAVWILSTVARRTLKDAGGAILSKQEYGYNGNLPGVGSPTLSKPDLSRLVNGTQTIDTKYVYDYGNVTETRLFKNYGSTSSQPSGAYVSTMTGYDTALKTYVLSGDPPLIPATTTTYDYSLGAPLTVTDPNGNITTTAYDGLGRVTSIKYPGYAQPNVKYTYPTPSGTPLSVSAPFAIKMEIWDEDAAPAQYRSAWQIMDSLGRVVQTQSPYETSGVLVLTDTSYNALGLVKNSGLPRTLTMTGGAYSAPNWGSIPDTLTTPDALGRVISVAYPDGSDETFSYTGLRTTIIDRDGHQKAQENDAFGRLIKVEEYTGSSPYTLYATTAYEYDERDLLKEVTDAAGNLTTIGYNGFSRKTSMSDPDLGYWTYGYDVFGNLTTQTDARNCVTTVVYDDLNRPTSKTYTGAGACNPTPDVTYTYDSITGGNEGWGRRTGMSDTSGSSTTWKYNVLGQVADETHTIESTNYTISTTYDAFGRPLAQTIPSQGSTENLTYNYNFMGALSSLVGTTTYVSNIHYEASGQVKDQQLGNGLRQQFCYDANTLRLTGLRTYSGALVGCGSTPSGQRLNLSYLYQDNGNVTQIVDATRSETQNFTYDELDRLTGATGAYSQSFAYNSLGNLMSAGTTILPGTAVGGYYHTCAVTTGGGAMCWGKNNEGQLGDGTTTPRPAPLNVSGLTSGVTTLAAGSLHTCALVSGGVKCWGYNSSGQLGDNSTTRRLTPVNVSGLTSGVTAIAAGEFHSCALVSGGVKCWGENSNGQLGNNSTTDSSVPVNVSGLTSGVTAITAGGSHTCALLSTGGVKCWGRNGQGQLGDGTTTQRLTPVDVSGLTSGVSVISAGYRQTCAVTTSGGAKCWGQNTNGQLGDNSTTQRNAPVDVNGLTSGVAGIRTGGFHTCARLTSSALKCWGLNSSGQVGDGTLTERHTPVTVYGVASGAVSMGIGYNHSCGMLSGNILKCWGSNSDGQLGQADMTYSTTPRVVVFASANYTYGSSAHKHAVTALSTGESYSYDANGNMTTRVEGGVTYTQTFDAENRLISVTAGGLTTQFIYDGDGNLVKKIKTDGSKTLYVGGIYEVDKNSGGTVTGTKTYYPAAGAMRNGSTLYYVLKDHLGSASVVTNSSGTIVGEDRFYPFGETRFTTGTMLTDKLFTGQREITGLGIYHYGARFYSPKLGRFLSADTIVPGFANPQNLNRYSYVTNNPLRYTDPTGHMLNENEYGGGCSTSGFCGTSTTSTSTPSNPDNDDEEEDEDTGGGLSPTTPDVTTPTLTEPTPAEGGANDYSCFNNPSACGAGTTPSSGSSGPDWGQIALGVGIILAVDLLIVAPIVVGIVLTPGALEATMLLTELGWVIPLTAAIVAVNVYGWNLIVEGAQGQ